MKSPLPRTRSLLLGAALALVAAPALADEPAARRAEAPTGALAVSLDDAVHRALARNPTAEIAEQEIRRAEALSRQARAAWLPTLSANGIYTQLDADRELGGRVVTSASQLRADLTLSVPIVAPQKWGAYSRSKDGIAVARAGQAEARRGVAVAAARAYLTIIAQRRVLATAERALATAKAHEEFAETRFQGGVGNRLDAVRAGQERATTEVRVRAQQAALVNAREALGVLLGEDRPVDAAEEPSFAAPPTPAAALEEAGERRADLAAQRDRVELARKAVRDSWLDYLPVLSANLQPFFQEPPTSTVPRTGWQAQLVLSIPLFDGGERYARADERRALEAQARARLEGALRQARSEVRVAFEAMRQADESLVAAREAAALASEALELAELAYRSGATSNIEVIDAERRAHDAETAAAVAEDASRQARLDLLAASGRFPSTP